MTWEDTAPLFETLDVLSDDQPHGAAYNMALDEVLLQGTLEIPLLRCYRWERPAASFGYFEPWQMVAECFPSHDLVRRWTGGGVVEHRRDWTYSLLLPRSEPATNLPAGGSYRLIHAHLRQALQVTGQHGVNYCAVATAVDDKTRACFSKPVRYDLMLGERKISGAAQRRTRAGLLHQGSVDLQRLEQAPTSERLLTAFENSLGVHRKPRMLCRHEKAAAASLAVNKYATDAWLHRC